MARLRSMFVAPRETHRKKCATAFSRELFATIGIEAQAVGAESQRNLRRNEGLRARVV